MIVCDVCGNEIESAGQKCPFCGSPNEDSIGKEPRQFSRKTINLEAGRPVVEIALNAMHQAIEDCLRNGVTVLTLIHGYGSSGKGGAIREECRKMLDYMKRKGTISNFIAGEDFCKRSGSVKTVLNQYPQLRFDRNLDRGNRGITIVILS